MLKQALLLPWVKKPPYLLFTQRMPEQAMLMLYMLMSRRTRTLKWAQPRVAILSSTVQMSQSILGLVVPMYIVPTITILSLHDPFLTA